MSEHRHIEVSLYAFTYDHDGSSLPIDALYPKRPEPKGYCVYTLDRNALGDGVHDELFDQDFDTLEAASAAFDEQCAMHPECEENVYSMPDAIAVIDAVLGEA